MRHLKGQSSFPSLSGMTLLELAIVLSAVGLMLGAIYAAVPSVYENYRVQKTNDDVASTVDAVRSSYASQAGMPQTGLLAITYSLIATEAIPPTLLRVVTASTPCTNVTGGAKALCADAPWGSYFPPGANDPDGTFRVCDWNLASAPKSCRLGAGPKSNVQAFAISIEGMPPGSCVQLATKITSTSGPTGLLELNINGKNLGPTAASPVPINPVGIPDATTACNKGVGANQISFVYRITSGS